MHIYEFRCADCGKVTNHFTRKIDTELTVACEHCKSERTSRMMSKFGRSYTRSDIIEKYGDPALCRDPERLAELEEEVEAVTAELAALDMAWRQRAESES